MMQHTPAVCCCPMRPALNNNQLVNPPIEPRVGYPLGFVTKNWFSCKWNQPLKEDVSYCLSCLSVIVCTFVQSKTLFSDPPMPCGTPCWPPNCRWVVTVLPQGNVKFHFQLYFTAFLWWLPGGEVSGKYVEMEESCFSRRKCNCGRLSATALGSPQHHWGHLSWTCVLSLHQDIARHV